MNLSIIIVIFLNYIYLYHTYLFYRLFSNSSNKMSIGTCTMKYSGRGMRDEDFKLEGMKIRECEMEIPRGVSLPQESN